MSFITINLFSDIVGIPSKPFTNKKNEWVRINGLMAKRTPTTVLVIKGYTL